MGAVVGLLAGLGVALVLLSQPSISTPARVRGPIGLSRLVEQSGIPRATTGSVLAACVGAGLITGVLVLIITTVPMAALIAAGVAGYAPVIVLTRRVRARQRALRTAWPDAVDGLHSAVRAGLSLPEAVAALAERGPQVLRPAFTEFQREYRATGSFGRALDVLQDTLRDPVADRVISALRIAREVGGTDLGVVLRTVSALLREDARTRGEIEARQSWTVNAARLAVAAPWITLALLCTRPEAARAYASVTGAFVLLAAAGISFVAYRVMVRIGRLPVEERMVAP